MQQLMNNQINGSTRSSNILKQNNKRELGMSRYLRAHIEKYKNQYITNKLESKRKSTKQNLRVVY